MAYQYAGSVCEVSKCGRGVGVLGRSGLVPSDTNNCSVGSEALIFKLKIHHNKF